MSSKCKDKSNNNNTKDALDKFFAKFKLPMLTEEQQESLGKNIQEKEVSETVAQMRNGKSPDHDAVPAEWFKDFRDNLAPYVTRTYSVDTAHRLRETMSLASISLILGKKKQEQQS